MIRVALVGGTRNHEATKLEEMCNGTKQACSTVSDVSDGSNTTDPEKLNSTPYT